MSLAVRPDALPVEELERRVRQVEPSALLVPPRILRRVIKAHRRLGGLGLRVPHRKSYIIDRDSLLQIATPAELRLGDHQPPPRVLLLPRPAAVDLAGRDAGQVLLEYWRLLFHSHVHLALAGRGVPVDDRVRELGDVVFDEARAVLRQDQYLLDPDSRAAVYDEFAAVFLELRYFAPRHLAATFPAAEDLGHVEQILTSDVDAEQLYHGLRLEGAADPADQPPPPPGAEEDEPDFTDSDAPSALRDRAEKASA